MKLVKTIIVASAFAFAGIAAAADGEAVFKDPKNLCVGCHKVDAKLVGPSLKDIAKHYNNDAGKADEVAKAIKAGSSGVFGPIPMPPNASISEEDAKAAAEYILSLK